MLFPCAAARFRASDVEKLSIQGITSDSRALHERSNMMALALGVLSRSKQLRELPTVIGNSSIRFCCLYGVAATIATAIRDGTTTFAQPFHARDAFQAYGAGSGIRKHIKVMTAANRHASQGDNLRYRNC